MEIRESAAFYIGQPSTKDRTRMTNIELRVAVGFSLGVPLAARAVCAICKALDVTGFNELTINRNIKRNRRIAFFNVHVREMFNAALRF